jgi:hypothetical protein
MEPAASWEATGYLGKVVLRRVRAGPGFELPSCAHNGLTSSQLYRVRQFVHRVGEGGSGCGDERRSDQAASGEIIDPRALRASLDCSACPRSAALVRSRYSPKAPQNTPEERKR